MTSHPPAQCCTIGVKVRGILFALGAALCQLLCHAFFNDYTLIFCNVIRRCKNAHAGRGRMIGAFKSPVYSCMNRSFGQGKEIREEPETGYNE